MATTPIVNVAVTTPAAATVNPSTLSVLFGILKDLLPDLIHLIEALMKGSSGPEKQAAVMQLLADGLSHTSLSPVVQQVIIGVANSLIPIFVKSFNADPANTAFTKA